MAQQPQNGYRFPENIGFRSRPHRLLYDPGNPNTVMPDLSGAQIVSLSCEPVTASSQRLYMTYIELQIPARAAGGRVFLAALTPGCSTTGIVRKIDDGSHAGGPRR